MVIIGHLNFISIKPKSLKMRLFIIPSEPTDVHLRWASVASDGISSAMTALIIPSEPTGENLFSSAASDGISRNAIAFLIISSSI